MSSLSIHSPNDPPSAAPPAVPLAVSVAPPPLVYDTADMCAVLRCSRATLHRLKAAEKLPRAQQLGGQLRWLAAEVADWVAAGMPELREWELRRENANGRPRRIGR